MDGGVEIGRTATLALVVTEADTALALRSGDVPVLGTPRLLALCEQACMAAVAGDLDPGETTVGMRAQLDHLAPVGVGSSVRAEVTLERIEGRRLVFTATVVDDAGLVAVGKITRVVVRREEFLEKAR